MLSQAEAADRLERIGHVPESYVHHDRQVEPREPLIVSGGILKWYNVHPVGDPVDERLEHRSRQKATELLESSDADLEYGMGIVVLHHSTANDFLFVGGWRGHQEYWNSVFIRATNSDEGWTPIEKGLFSPVLCVWEMTPLWHERNAWVTYLESPRSIDDRRTWLSDRLTAVMGA